jgi:hypothetical protein
VNQGLPAGVKGGGELGIHRLPQPLRVALAGAIHPAFLAAAIVSALVFFIALFGIHDVSLRTSLDDLPAGEAGVELAAAAPDTGSSRSAAR